MGHFIWYFKIGNIYCNNLFWNMICCIGNPKVFFTDYSWLYEYIIWTFRLFLAVNLRLCGKMNFQKIEKNINNLEILKRKNGIDLVLKFIN